MLYETFCKLRDMVKEFNAITGETWSLRETGSEYFFKIRELDGAVMEAMASGPVITFSLILQPATTDNRSFNIPSTWTPAQIAEALYRKLPENYAKAHFVPVTAEAASEALHAFIRARADKIAARYGLTAASGGQFLNQSSTIRGSVTGAGIALDLTHLSYDECVKILDVLTARNKKMPKG